MWQRAELKENAKLILRANYWKAVLVGLILTLLTGGSVLSSGRSASIESSVNSSGDVLSGNFFHDERSLFLIMAALIALAVGLLVRFLVSIFVMNPLEVGCQRYFIECRTRRPEIVPCLTYAFRNGYLNPGIVMFLRTLFTMLWSLLFVVPGIIKSYEYRMIPYLLAENPQMEYREAFQRSREMMYGHKMDAFVLDCSFIGWYFLSGLTCGILGVFYVMPYVHLTNAELYHALSNLSYRQY